MYCIRVNKFESATDNVYIMMRFETGGSFLDSGSLYSNEGYGYSTDNANGDQIYIFDGVSDSDPSAFSLWLLRPSDDSDSTYCYWAGMSDRQGTSPNIFRWGGAGMLLTAGAVTGVQFFCHSGNVAAFEGSVYGLENS